MSEIEKAIKYYQEFYEDFKEDFSNNERIRLEMVLQALQEKQECEKGCEYCNEHKPTVSNYSEYSIEIDNAKLSIWQDLKCLEIFNINLCPMCGRRLGENDE